jgi:hypothetical protein
MRQPGDGLVEDFGQWRWALRYDCNDTAHAMALRSSSFPPSALLGKARDALFRPTAALPLDCFRVLFGIVAAAYFLHLFREAPEVSGPDGLLDHALTREIFWYTAVSLFQPGMPLEWLRGAFLSACLASLALAAGYYPRVAALFMFLVAVSAYRLNFLVFYWDDGLMHLFMFWLLLLPTGTTLTLRGWQRDGRDAWQRWRQAVVPGATVRCFAWNLALIYFVSGAWKLTSPMWIRGDALFVTLHTPAAYMPALWSPSYQPLYRLGNYATLALELLSPLFLVLRPWHPMKGALLILLLGFHLGIIATLRVPFSNVALLCALVLLFRDEVMSVLPAVPAAARAEIAPGRASPSGVFALAFVAVLTLATTRFLPGVERLSIARYDSVANGIDSRAVGGLSDFHKALYAALWFIGIAQEYQLFNWIDIRNYTVSYEVVLRDAAGTRTALDPTGFFPDSTRAVLLQAYLHNLIWFNIPDRYRERLRLSLSQRLATRYCRAFHPVGNVSVTSRLMRIRTDGGTTEPQTRTLMQFECGAADPATLARMR